MKRRSFEELKSVLIGAVETEVLENGLHARKCTQKQIAAWQAEHPTLGGTARATTGIRLDFLTDSKRMRFAFSSGKKVELLIDGLLREQFDMDAYRAKGEAAEVVLTNSRKDVADEYHITLTFPSHDAPGVLEFLELDDGAYIKPCTYDCKMLMIGDSITQGWASEYDSHSYAYRVSRFFNANSIIQGVGGGVFLKTTLDHIDFDPDVVTVAFGTNDGLTKPLDFFCENAKAVLDFLAEEYRGKKIFVISPIWRGHSDGRTMEEFFVAYRAWLEAHVRERADMTLIEGLTLLPPLPLYYRDTYLHPNDLGFAVYAENLIAQLQKHL